MIKELHVTNFAIIEDIIVFFDDKMTALTGQTGAGKSLIIDCIGLLLGARADLDMIRHGADKTTIKGLFTYNNEKIDEILNKYGIEISSILEIKREISNKSSIKINNNNVTLNQLKEITPYLADIHVQNDTLRLINSENYINIIDNYSNKKIDNLYNKYQIALLDYKKAYNEYLLSNQKNEEANDKLDFWKYQYKEISDLDLKENELEGIEKEINVLSNYDKIFNSLNEANISLDSLDEIYNTYNSLKKISEYDEKYDKYANEIENSYYVLEDIRNEIKKEIIDLDFSKEYLDSLLTRENEINKICKKYQKNQGELLSYKDKIKKEISKHENYDQYIKEVYDSLKTKHKSLTDISNELQKLREETSLILEKNLIAECQNLDLQNIDFKIKFTKNDITDPLNVNSFLTNGISNAEFLISLNKGEPLKPLNKVASGGEISRIMLGFKSILISKQNLSFIVFDEIDSGISGVTASKIAKKIKEISNSTQVLCITHLPHVASIADQQLNIVKYEEKNRTYTKVVKLNKDDRIKEIAIMISGERLTENAINNAKELLNQ